MKIKKKVCDKNNLFSITKLRKEERFHVKKWKRWNLHFHYVIFVEGAILVVYSLISNYSCLS